MREIKFRARDNNSKSFVIGSLIIGKQFSGAPFAQIENADANNFEQYQVDIETVGQFTGYQDRNHEDLYEGDVVSDMNKRWLIVWCKLSGAFRLQRGSESITIRGADCWVFKEGNIHEHPELLGGYGNP